MKRILLFSAIVASALFFHWAFTHEVLIWNKTLPQAFISSWWNWILFGTCIGIVVYLSLEEARQIIALHDPTRARGSYTCVCIEGKNLTIYPYEKKKKLTK